MRSFVQGCLFDPTDRSIRMRNNQSLFRARGKAKAGCDCNNPPTGHISHSTDLASALSIDDDTCSLTEAGVSWG